MAQHSGYNPLWLQVQPPGPGAGELLSQTVAVLNAGVEHLIWQPAAIYWAVLLIVVLDAVLDNFVHRGQNPRWKLKLALSVPFYTVLMATANTFGLHAQVLFWLPGLLLLLVPLHFYQIIINASRAGLMPPNVARILSDKLLQYATAFTIRTDPDGGPAGAADPAAGADLSAGDELPAGPDPVAGPAEAGPDHPAAVG